VNSLTSLYTSFFTVLQNAPAQASMLMVPLALLSFWSPKAGFAIVVIFLVALFAFAEATLGWSLVLMLPFAPFIIIGVAVGITLKTARKFFRGKPNVYSD
jgi:hypothetical protein